MNIDRFDFERAKEKGIISSEQVDLLMNFFNTPSDTSEIKAKLNVTNFLYYFGAFLIILAMCWFLGNVWGTYKEGGLFIVTLLYTTFFILTANYLWKKGLKTPAGLLYTAAVSSIPLLTFLFEKIIGIWPLDNQMKYSGFHIWIRGSWVLMEVMTIIGGLFVLKFRKFPFLTLPISWATWYMSMDIVPILAGNFDTPSWDERKIVSFIFGLILISVAFLYDKRTKEDFSFWFYLFGTITFWSSLIAMTSFSNEGSFLLFASYNIFFMFISILLQRKVFMVFGSIGFFIYLGHLAYNTFKNSIAFPLSLTAIGLIIIFLGIYYQKNQSKIENYVEGLVPENIKKHLPKYRTN